MNRRIPFFLLLVFLAAFGCKKGLDTNYVEGLVTLDGEPLAGASVSFYPVGEGPTAGGFSNNDGMYKITSHLGEGGKGAPAGEYTVTVSKTKVVPLPKPITLDDGERVTETTEQVLPSVYRDKRKTPLKFTVVKGKNRFDIPLLSKP